jgi:formylglycine-generating enzyme required for sulfatase activity
VPAFSIFGREKMKKVAGIIIVLLIVCVYVFLLTSIVDIFALGKLDTTIVSDISQNDNSNIMTLFKEYPILNTILGCIITFFLTILAGYIIYKYKIKDKKKVKKRNLKTEEDRYLNFIITENEKLTFQGFETQVRVPILLWDIYVPLRVNMSGIRMRDMEMQVREEIQEPRDIPVQEAVQLASDKNYDGLVILGDPGAGKTTLLKYFLLCFARKEAAKRLNLPGDLLPILLPLRSVDLKQTFIKAICEQFVGYDLKLTDTFFLDRLDKGKAIVLLDGLDEVADEKTRIKMCKWIDKFRTRFNKCPFIITSRFAGYRGDVKLPGAYLELKMLDFSKKDIQQFLHSWYTAVETSLHEDNNIWRTKAQKSAGELFNRIEKNSDYYQFAVNPLMLQLIALVHYDFQQVPDRRVELYEKCMDLLLQKWDEAKGLKMLLSAKEARQVLQPLALWMHSEENRRQASKKEVLKQITPHIQDVKKGIDAEKLLSSIRDRSGVFVGFGTETYGFQHHSFQEYLTAEEIRNEGNVDILVKHFDESWWREPTLLALGLGNPSIFEPFMDLFMRSKKNDGAAADFMLKCVKEAIKRSEKPFEDAMKNRDLPWQARYNGLLCLAVVCSDKAKRIVESLKKDPQVQVANKAKELLLEWGIIQVKEMAEADESAGIVKRFFNPVEDNAEYIYIPGGTYVMGELEKKVTVEPFYIAKFPVTNRLYGKFIEETKYDIPEYWNNRKYNRNEQPVVGVSWYDAVKYCKWLTGKDKENRKFRLSTEEEWEWAASRGERKYPWGNNEPDHKKANYDDKIGYPTPVGSYPDGATPDGLMDMAGNVWEWTDSIYKDGEDWRVLRGGSFGIDTWYVRCACRLRCSPNFRSSFIGFRLVLSPFFL